MNTPWIIATCVALLTFAILEGYAFKHPERENTLSRAVYTIGSQWPISIWFMGIFCGGLGVHFFWHWCPDMSQSIGMLDLKIFAGI